MRMVPANLSRVPLLPAAAAHRFITTFSFAAPLQLSTPSTPQNRMAEAMAEPADVASVTVTVQQQQQQQQQQQAEAGTARTPSQPGETAAGEEATPAAAVLTLRLRPRPSVTWSADVINNEGMGKKSSKRCCIFHKKRNFDESDSDESDSDADDEERERRWAQPKPGRPKAHQLYHG